MQEQMRLDPAPAVQVIIIPAIGPRVATGRREEIQRDVMPEQVGQGLRLGSSARLPAECLDQAEIIKIIKIDAVVSRAGELVNAGLRGVIEDPFQAGVPSRAISGFSKALPNRIRFSVFIRAMLV